MPLETLDYHVGVAARTADESMGLQPVIEEDMLVFVNADKRVAVGAMPGVRCISDPLNVDEVNDMINDVILMLLT